jgi:hypothetical protein
LNERESIAISRDKDVVIDRTNGFIANEFTSALVHGAEFPLGSIAFRDEIGSDSRDHFSSQFDVSFESRRRRPLREWRGKGAEPAGAQHRPLAAALA